MKTKLYFSLLAVILLFGGCEKSDPTTDQSGNVVLSNDEGVFSSHEGIKVSIEGTDLSTYSDASGNWTIKGVKASTQTIIFEKSGFGIYKEEITPSSDHPNFMSSFELPEIPKFSCKNLTANLIAGGIIKINGEFSDPAQPTKRGVAFFGKTNSVSREPSTWLFKSDEMDIISFDSNFDMSITISELYLKGFSSGNTVYIITYGTANGVKTTYFDSKTQKYVYGCLSTTPSNVVSIKLP